METPYLILLILLIYAKNSTQSKNEARLYEDLLDLYQTLERPGDSSERFTIKFGLTVLQIVGLDEHNGILTTNSWLNLEWIDKNLQWNPEEYGNITSISLKPNRIWKPDILMYNSMDEGFDATFHTNVVVKSNGSVHYIPPGIFRSSCKIDLTSYPYDVQRCGMKFGSWTYDEQKVDIILRSEEGGDLSQLISHGQWDVLEIPARKNTIDYSCCPDPFVDVTFTIHLQRRGQDVIKSLMVKFVFISIVSLLGFLLPVYSKFKLIFGMTAFFSTMFSMYMTSKSFPRSVTSAPFLCKYFAVLIFIVISSVLASISILNCIENSKEASEMPQWLRIAALKYIPLMLFKKQRLTNNSKSKSLEKQSPDGFICSSSELSGTANEIIKITADKFRMVDIQDERAKDWIFAANVLNLFFRYVLIIITVISTVVLFL